LKKCKGNIKKYGCFQRFYSMWLRTRGAFTNVQTEGKVPAKSELKRFEYICIMFQIIMLEWAETEMDLI